MPRKPRTLSSTGIYHIILRAVNQHIIFEEDSDFQKFLFILSDCKKKYVSLCIRISLEQHQRLFKRKKSFDQRVIHIQYRRIKGFLASLFCKRS
jgi:hypothetical protein